MVGRRTQNKQPNYKLWGKQGNESKRKEKKHHNKKGTMAYVRFEVFAAVTMKIGVFWDIETQFVPHRRHITSPLQSPAG
jgi:hypothetical protein